jgi:hypothetical protein
VLFAVYQGAAYPRYHRFERDSSIGVSLRVEEYLGVAYVLGRDLL